MQEKKTQQKPPFTISLKWQIWYRWRILLNRIVEMSFYIITTPLPNQMECLWLLAWKRLANKATHGRIQRKEKHGLTWDTNNINIFPRMKKTSWNSLNHSLELLSQTLQEEIEILSEAAGEDISERSGSWGVSWSPPELGIYSSLVFETLFSESNRQQIASVQMCVYAAYTCKGSPWFRDFSHHRNQ